MSIVTSSKKIEPGDYVVYVSPGIGPKMPTEMSLNHISQGKDMIVCETLEDVQVYPEDYKQLMKHISNHIEKWLPCDDKHNHVIVENNLMCGREVKHHIKTRRPNINTIIFLMTHQLKIESAKALGLEPKNNMIIVTKEADIFRGTILYIMSRQDIALK